MTLGKVTTERRGHVLLIGLDRAAKKNAFDLPMYEALASAYGDYDRDDALRCAVLFAHGDHFTAGLDLAQFAPVFASGTWNIREGALDPVGLSGPRLGKPIVCAIAGICLTIGIELLLATDIRIAARTARFGQIEVRRGIYPVGGATLRLPREVGWANAMRYLLIATSSGPRRRCAWVSSQEVTEPGAQVDRAIAIAETVAAQAPLGVRATLASARAALPDSEARAAARLLPDLAPILASEDAAEGIASFLERRTASFKGK
jgi:enoyl-CoA hydratase/carnithine racemase